MDQDISKNLIRILKRQGINFQTNCAVTSVQKSKNTIKVKYNDNKKEIKESIETDIVLVATGRKAYSGGLYFEGIGGVINDKGMVETDIIIVQTYLQFTLLEMLPMGQCLHTRLRRKAY